MLAKCLALLLPGILLCQMEINGCVTTRGKIYEVLRAMHGPSQAQLLGFLKMLFIQKVRKIKSVAQVGQRLCVRFSLGLDDVSLS